MAPMARQVELKTHLETWAGGDPRHEAVATTVLALAKAAVAIAALIAKGPLAGDLGAVRRGNIGGDVQKELDLVADRLLARALADAPVAWYASEEVEQPEELNPGAPLCVALDPLDGSSNIETNVSVGTIFSILPNVSGDGASFLQPGTAQLAAGYIVYGPQTALVLSLGEGTSLFVLDHDRLSFHLVRERIEIPERTSEFAINASNHRHWEEAIRLYVDDCLAGAEGPRAKDFNMRWIASLVAEATRILVRGGVFLYPGDARKGYRDGRLRLLYEANPIAFLIEQAGGAASTGRQRILDVEPTSLHQRIALIFGSAKEVARIERYCSEPAAISERAPLFGKRGLFRV
jgi:fructose-1,6-bisphosphatase I